MVNTVIESMSVNIIFMTNVLTNFVMFLFTDNVAFGFGSPLISEAVSVWYDVVFIFVGKVAFEVVELFELCNVFVSVVFV